MKPQDKHRVRYQDGISRARLLLKKNLGWLPGFPVSVEDGRIRWCSIPGERSTSGKLVSINRECVRRMQMTLTKLRHHFPNALPRIVENVDNWLARMDFLLHILKRGVHLKQPLKIDVWNDTGILEKRWLEKFHHLYHRHQKLASLLESVFYLEVTSPNTLSHNILNWIDQHAVQLGSIEPSTGLKDQVSKLEIQLMLCRVRGELNPKILTMFFQGLSDPCLWSLSSLAPSSYLAEVSTQIRRAAKWKSFYVPDQNVSQSMAETLLKLLQKLTHSNKQQCRNASDLLAHFIQADSVSIAGQLQDQLQREENRLLRILRRKVGDTSKLPHRKSEQDKLIASSKLSIDELHVQSTENLNLVIQSLLNLTHDHNRTKTCLRFFERFPQNKMKLQQKLFCYWEGEHHNLDSSHYHQKRYRDFEQVLKFLSSVFSRRGVHRTLLAQWSHAFEKNKHSGWEFVTDLVDEHTSFSIHKRTVCLMEDVVYQRNLPIQRDLLCCLNQFVLATNDDNRSAQIVSELVQNGKNKTYLEPTIRTTLAITQDNKTAAIILGLLENEDQLSAPATILANHIKDQQLLSTIEAMILAEDHKALNRIATITQVVIHLGKLPPNVPDYSSDSSWVNRYPDALHPELFRLNQVTLDAQVIADKLLLKDFPSDSALRQEIEAIQFRIDSEHQLDRREHLQIRVCNLKQRVDLNSTISPKRMENLIDNIRVRIKHEIVSQYINDCRDLTVDHLKSHIKSEANYEKLCTAPHNLLLSGILQLKPQPKQTGLNLLFQSLDDPEIDCSHEPKNQAFLKKIEKLGVDLNPWLMNSSEISGVTQKDEPYRLYFTSSVIDILMMGFHFDTCLSPNSFNFFSTIANVTDINKQVLYAKTSSGRTIGRCLFTLSDEGMIQTYQRYAHDPADEFSEAVDKFVTQLASEMNTQLSVSGNVSLLVAKDWYDDGAVGNGLTLDLNHPDSSVRTALRTISVDTILEKLEELLGSDRLVKHMLFQILSFQEFSERAELIQPFVDKYGLDRSVANQERLRIAVLAHKAGFSESASSIISDMRHNKISVLLNNLNHYGVEIAGIGSYQELFNLLIYHSPTLALRILRATRSIDVRSDLEEENYGRKTALASTHRALGRNQLATQIESTS